MKLREELTLQKIGKDYVIVEPEKGELNLSNIYSLNESAAWVWKQLTGSRFSASDVKAMLMVRYNLFEDQASEDADKLIRLFKQHHLIH